MTLFLSAGGRRLPGAEASGAKDFANRRKIFENFLFLIRILVCMGRRP
jgi:hypothetical protein